MRGNLDGEFSLESPFDASCLQTDASLSIFSTGAGEYSSYAYCEYEQEAKYTPEFDENLAQDFDPDWTSKPSLDRNKSLELKELTLGLVSNPYPDSDFLSKVSEALNSVLQDELQAIGPDKSSPETK